MNLRNALFSQSHSVILVPLLVIDTVGLLGNALDLWPPIYRALLIWTVVGYWMAVAVELWTDRRARGG